MKRSKGFTLIELLTVIAILAIILLIAAPTILGVLDKARKNTFKNQVLLYVEGLKQQVALSAIEGGNITLPDAGGEITVDISNIPMDTNAGLSGSIKIENEGGNYKYTILAGVHNADYKITKNVEAGSLDLSAIEKNDGTSTSENSPRKTSFVIGDEVTLVDGSTWYVIEDSPSSSDTVTLFASQNIKNDASGWTTTMSEYIIAFDEANARSTEKNSYCINPKWGCNIYAANGSTVTEDSSIKKFIDSKVLPYINNSLTTSGGTAIDSNSIRLLTKDEYNTIKSNSWSYSTWYWTQTPNASGSDYVYIVFSNGRLASNLATTEGYGARPVIVINKSNIK